MWWARFTSRALSSPSALDFWQSIRWNLTKGAWGKRIGSVVGLFSECGPVLSISKKPLLVGLLCLHAAYVVIRRGTVLPSPTPSLQDEDHVVVILDPGIMRPATAATTRQDMIIPHVEAVCPLLLPRVSPSDSPKYPVLLKRSNNILEIR